MHRRTERDSQAQRAETSLPYAVLGLRIGRRVRRHKPHQDLQRQLQVLRTELAQLNRLVQSSDLEASERVVTELGLGLAYDVPMFASSMVALADHALRTASPTAADAYRVAAKVFHQARLARLELVALAGHIRKLLLEARELAALEPRTPTVDREWPDETGRLESPDPLRLIESVTPTNGPNSGTKALYALGSVALAA